jgi:hypothetical protein
VPLGLKLFNLLHWTDRAIVVWADAFAFQLEHGLGMERDVRTGPGVGGWRQVVRVGLTRHFEHSHCDLQKDAHVGQQSVSQSVRKGEKCRSHEEVDEEGGKNCTTSYAYETKQLACKTSCDGGNPAITR